MNKEYENIIWHPHTESPDKSCQVLVRIWFDGDEISSPGWQYHIWQYINDSEIHNFNMFKSKSFYILHNRDYTSDNVCLPGDGEHRYFEWRSCYSERRLVHPDYEWAYLE